jgi:hypothetical protein
MKKSVILTISIIYILAIVIVGFLGIALKVYNEQVYVEQIKCISEGYIEKPDDPNCNGEIVAELNQEIVIKCQALPDNASNPNFRYDYDESGLGEKYEIVINADGTCTVKLLQKTTIYLSVVPIDRTSNIELTIKIYVKKGISDIL